MQLALAYPGTTPTYWTDAEDRLLVTALDELDARTEGRRTRGRQKR